MDTLEAWKLQKACFQTSFYINIFFSCWLHKWYMLFIEKLENPKNHKGENKNNL